MALPLITDLGPGSPNAPYAFQNVGTTAQGTGPFTTTPDFTPLANSLVLVFACFGLPSPVDTNEPNYILTDDSSLALDWEKITAARATFTTDGSAVQAWYTEIGDDTEAMALTLTHTGLLSYAMKIYVLNIIGHQPGDPIGLFAIAVNTNNDYDIDLGAAPGEDDLIVSCMQLVGNQEATNVVITPDTGWTEHDNNVATSSFVRTQVQYGPGSLGQVVGRTATTTTGSPFNQRVGVAVAIRAESNLITVDAAQVAVAGQDITVGDYHITVEPAAVAIAGQNIDILNPIIDVTTADVAIAAQNITILGGDASMDLMGPLYVALADDTFITSRLGTFMSPAIFTRMPIPDEQATYPMIVVQPPSLIGNEDGLVVRRPVLNIAVVVYGAQDDQYRTVEELGYYIRNKFHRQKRSITVNGFSIIDIVANGPIPGPTDDFRHVARAVTLTIRMSEE